MPNIFREIDVTNARLAIGIRPSHFASNINVSILIGKREMGVDNCGRAQWLSRQNVQTVLAQVEQDAFHLIPVFDL